jgi:hypothetical protein
MEPQKMPKTTLRKNKDESIPLSDFKTHFTFTGMEMA